MAKDNIAKRTITKALCLAAVASAAYFFISVGHASEHKRHETHAAEEVFELGLSKDLKAILNQEMNKIEAGMMKIIPAIAAGDWEAIAHIAGKIRDSFILKQKLTPKQIKELHHSLPSEFVDMDRDFHSTAGKLAYAAEKKDGELVNFYFYNLHSQCMKCHARYAPKRFPRLREVKPSKNHHR